MGILLAIVFFSILASTICSILEAAILSLTPSHIASYREDNPVLYEQLRGLKARIDQPLAAILTLNTIAHTFGAAGVGAQVGRIYGDGQMSMCVAKSRQ